jgi:hypothetical protein
VDRDLFLLIMAAVAESPITDGRALPRLAEALISKGLESPAAIELMILGTETFDPRDARQIAGQMLTELGVSAPPDDRVVDMITGLAALALERELIHPRALTYWASQLFIKSGYRAGELVMRLFATNDAWDSGWISNEEVEAEVRRTASMLLASIPGMTDAMPEDPDWDVLVGCLPATIWPGAAVDGHIQARPAP